MGRYETITKILIDDVKERMDVKELFPAKTPKATEMVLQDPYAFLIATCLDRGTKADVIWTIPYDLHRTLGHLDVKKFAAMDVNALDRVIRSLPHKPRYVNDAARTVMDLSRMIRDRFDGNAEKLWRERSPMEFERDLRSLHGVGPGIASMATNLLVRRDDEVFSGANLQYVDIKPDVHTVRVLYRLGVAVSQDENAAVDAARKLSPSYPGHVDGPLWWIGRKWCRASEPDCSACPMRNSCKHAQEAGVA